MPGTPREQLASLAAVAEVTGNLDRLLDQLFANVAELKVILAQDTADGKAPQ